MNVKEASKDPSYRDIASILPDEAEIERDFVNQTIRISLTLRVSTLMGASVFKNLVDDNVEVGLVKDWFRQLREKLTECEVKYRMKIGEK